MGGGMWMENGVHAVDWLTHCIGAKAVTVKAKQSTSMHYQGADDVTTAFVQYANGIPGLLVVVGSAHGCATDGIEAHCALGEIQYTIRGSVRVGVNNECARWSTTASTGSASSTGTSPKRSRWGCGRKRAATTAATSSKSCRPPRPQASRAARCT